MTGASWPDKLRGDGAAGYKLANNGNVIISTCAVAGCPEIYECLWLKHSSTFIFISLLFVFFFSLSLLLEFVSDSQYRPTPPAVLQLSLAIISRPYIASILPWTFTYFSLIRDSEMCRLFDTAVAWSGLRGEEGQPRLEYFRRQGFSTWPYRLSSSSFITCHTS